MLQQHCDGSGHNPMLTPALLLLTPTCQEQGMLPASSHAAHCHPRGGQQQQLGHRPYRVTSLQSNFCLGHRLCCSGFLLLALLRCLAAAAEGDCAPCINSTLAFSPLACMAVVERFY